MLKVQNLFFFINTDDAIATLARLNCTVRVTDRQANNPTFSLLQ